MEIILFKRRILCYSVKVMRKFLVLLFAPLILCLQPSYAIEDDASVDEVILEKTPLSSELEEMGFESALESPSTNKEKTLKEKLEDIYHLEVTEIDKNNYLLTDILTKHFGENSLIESIHPFAGYNGNLNFLFNGSDSFKTTYGFNAVNAGIDGKFKNDSADFRLLFSFPPISHRNFVRNMFSDVYIGTNKIPNHRIQIGYQRPPNGMEGKISAYQLPFIYRAQISRNFGTVRKIGARIIGDFDLIEYDLGGFSSDTYLQSFMPGAEFDGWINFKPLGKTDGKYGKIKLGGGLQSGHKNHDYCVTGAYASYEYKNFMANFEWANADGYNGPSGTMTNKHASGFYATLGYRITPKVQVLARFDEFNPDCHVKNDKTREYSLGLNYYIKGPGLKLIFNYVFCQNEAINNSHKLMIGTQILL